MKKTYIYILRCPETGNVRYVGKSNNPKKRYHEHLRYEDRTASTHKKNWIKKLLDSGLAPKLEIIDKVDNNEWKFWEKYYIKYYKNKGCNLVNCTEGGDGMCGRGNVTSFKKGNVPWNKGTRRKKRCIICGNFFEVSPSGNKKYKCCSMKCSSKYRSVNLNSGVFSKGNTPWNKGKYGYITSRKGCSISDEVKQKISNALKGRFNLGPSKPVVQVDKITGQEIKIYLSIAQASRDTGICKSSISNNITGRSKSAGGYVWVLKEEI